MTRLTQTQQHAAYAQYEQAVARLVTEAIAQVVRDERLDPGRYSGMTNEDRDAAVYFALGNALIAQGDAMGEPDPGHSLADLHEQMCEVWDPEELGERDDRSVEGDG